MLPSLSFYRGTNSKTYESIRNWRDYLIPIKINDGDIKQISDIYKLSEEKQRDNNGYEFESKNSNSPKG